MDASTLPVGPSGRALCRWCEREVPVGRMTFCSKECVTEWKVRTDKAFMRRMVWKRDRSVCAFCQTNCDRWKRTLRKEWTHINELPQSEEREHRKRTWTTAHPYFFQRTSFWDADHVVPVVKGGGECGLDNLRTLCLFCHRKVTAQLNKQRAKERRERKNQSQ